MLRSHALISLFSNNLDHGIEAIFLTARGGHLLAYSTPAPPHLKQTGILCALTWHEEQAYARGPDIASLPSPPQSPESGQQQQQQQQQLPLPGLVRRLKGQGLRIVWRMTADEKSKGKEKGGLAALAVEVEALRRKIVLMEVAEGLVLGIMGPEQAMEEELPKEEKDKKQRNEKTVERGLKRNDGEEEEDDDDEEDDGDEEFGRSEEGDNDPRQRGEAEEDDDDDDDDNDNEEMSLALRKRYDDEKELRLLYVKADAMAEYLREELKAFRMPR